MKRKPRICYAGTYEREYPRNRLVVRALRDAGIRVEEAQIPVFDRTQNKSTLSAATITGLKLLLAYPRLVPDVTLRLLRCDALAVGYIGQLDMLVLGTLARVMRRPVLFNPLVTLTDTIVEDRQRTSPGSPIARIIAGIDKLALRNADVILVDTPENGAYLQHRFMVPKCRIHPVAVGADDRMFFPAESNRKNDSLDILFYGKFIPLHGIETILRAATILSGHNFPGRIEMIGIGQEYGRMREIARGLALDNVIWTDWIPYERLGERIREADIVLGIFDGGAKAARVIPNKIYQALACGKPVITRRGPAIERLLTDGESALLIPPADPPALAAAIRQLSDDGLRTRLASAGHDAWFGAASADALRLQLSPALARLGLTP